MLGIVGRAVRPAGRPAASAGLPPSRLPPVVVVLAAMSRAILKLACLAGSASALACGGGSEPSRPAPSSSSAPQARGSAGTGTTAASASGAAATTASQGASQASASANASEGTAPPAVGAFGPDISRTAVEGVNASAAYEHNQPHYALDGKPDTAWSAPGEAKPWLEISLLPGTRVDGIELAGQREATKAKDYWTGDSVIKRARVVWDGGEAEVGFARATDKGLRKKVAIGAVTRRVRLEILEIERGDKSADVDIDELGLFGTAPATAAPDAQGLTGLCRAGHLRVRFKGGAVVGGEWVDPPGGVEPLDGTPLFRWLFFPIAVRADDGEWHTLGVRYAEESEMLDDGTKSVTARSVGKLLRFRAGSDGFEADQDGVKASGKCEKK